MAGEGEAGIIPVASETVAPAKVTASEILARAKGKVDAILRQPTPQELREQEIERDRQNELLKKQQQKEIDTKEEERLVGVNNKLVEIVEQPGLSDFLKAYAKSKKLPKGEIVLLTHDFSTLRGSNVLPVIKMDQDGRLLIPGHTLPDAEDFNLWQEFGIATQDQDFPPEVEAANLYTKMYSRVRTQGEGEKIPPIIRKGEKTFMSQKKQLVEGPLVRWFYTLDESVFGKFTPEDLENNFTANLEKMSQVINEPEGPTSQTSTPPSTPLSGPTI